MSNKDYLLYLVMSSSCSHCVKLKSTILPKIENAVGQLGNVEFQKIELQSMKDSVPSDLSHLTPYVKWFPTFVFVPSKGGSSLKASVFNGEFLDGKLTYKNEFPMTETGISDWCQREIGKNPGLKKANEPVANKKKIYNENENLIPTTVCSKKIRPRSHV
jgi:hypothetical protein